MARSKLIVTLFRSEYNQVKQFAPFGRRTRLATGRCSQRYIPWTQSAIS